jgi:hypothetical protein
MAMWMYQLSQLIWPTDRFRLEIWEGERWRWNILKVQRMDPQRKGPRRGDILVFYYAPYGGEEGGFYGWGVITDVYETEKGNFLYFRPVTPTNFMKMCPWNDDKSREIVDKIRGGFRQGTLWHVPQEIESEIRKGFHNWITGQVSKK